MEPFSGLLAIAPFAIEFLKEQRHGREATDETTFRKWLEDVVFPQMLEDSGRMLRTLVASQKAHHAELRGQLTAQLDAIQDTLRSLLASQPAVPTLRSGLAALDPATRAILAALLANTTTDDYERAQASLPIVLDGLDTPDLEVATRRLDEAGLLRLHSYAGGGAARFTALGFLVATAAEDEERFRAGLERIRDALRSGSAPVDKVVALTAGRCTVAFVHAVAEQWDRCGWVALQKLDQRAHSRIDRPSQSLSDASEKDLVAGALRPFLP